MDHFPESTYHDGILLLAAIRARDTAIADLRHRGDTALTAEAIAAIVLSAAATEAFANELPARIHQAMRHGYTIPAAMSSCAFALDELETARANTTAKYQIAALTLSGAIMDTGRQPYQGLHQLHQLRNAIMHPKPIPDIKRLLASLTQRGLTTDQRQPAAENVKGLTWLDRLQEPAIARWACATAHQSMSTILAMVAVHSDALSTVTDWLTDKQKFPT